MSIISLFINFVCTFVFYMITPSDIQYMRRAMTLAQKGEGKVSPNPMVGAVVVRFDEHGNGQVIAEGWHRCYGDLHAERDAFRVADGAGCSCEGATMYVTLEPCCHHGHQPPCTEAIIEHRLKRVVVGLTDPNPLVAGKGISRLKDAGIEVEMIGLSDEGKETEAQLRHQNRVFLHYMTSDRPWVVMKYAMSLDGKICTRTGDSRWISGKESRNRVHVLRNSLMAIACGIGTVLADDPMLDTRLEDRTDARNPIRFILDRRLRLPLDSRIASSANRIRTVVVHTEGVDADRIETLRERNIETWCCKSLCEMLQRMRHEGIDGLLLEGGGTINEAFIREKLVDEVYAFIAPKIIGGAEAKTPIEGEGVARMAEAVHLHGIHTERIGDDLLVIGLCSQE